MKEYIQKIFGRKIDKKLVITLCVGLAGVLLILMSSLTKSEQSEHNRSDYSVAAEDCSDYVSAMEKKLTDMISDIYGAGKTKVMVTLENGSEQILARKDDSKTSSSDDGDRKSESRNESSEYVILRSDNTENGLVLKVIQPKIRGVAVLCQGADKVSVRQSITELLTAVLGIGSNRVNISKIAD
ncbi:MAG: hypothetical protein K5756_04075 [Clostridiales bacterium]|nr:hypothetical protein [Clostridiales bacterium]